MRREPRGEYGRESKASLAATGIIYFITGTPPTNRYVLRHGWLERALCIDPSEPSVHLRLAELYDSLGDAAGLVRARRSVLDLDPVDRPEALYQLARAHQKAGDVAAARRAVLEALELAPRFRRAQTLLLELHRAQARPSGGPS